MTPEEILAWTLRWEGSGYTDHPKDRGGATKYGITLRTLQGLGSIGDVDRDGDIDKADVKALDHATATRIYRQLFYVGTADVLQQRDWRVALVVYDAGVHSGTGWTRRRLQEVLGVPQDGVLGPVTFRAFHAALLAQGAVVLCRQLLACRTRLWAGLLERDPRQWAFSRGWANRLADLCQTIGVQWPDGPPRAHFDSRHARPALAA